jgi:predicted nucleic acid-binding Zn ribbon protein
VKKSNEILLKDAIEAFLKDNKLQHKLDETRLLSAWEPVTGQLIARHTLNLSIRDRVLYVKVDSAALREELQYQKSKLLKRLNKKAGVEAIDDIKFG